MWRETQRYNTALIIFDQFYIRPSRPVGVLQAISSGGVKIILSADRWGTAMLRAGVVLLGSLYPVLHGNILSKENKVGLTDD